MLHGAKTIGMMTYRGNENGSFGCTLMMTMMMMMMLIIIVIIIIIMKMAAAAAVVVVGMVVHISRLLEQTEKYNFCICQYALLNLYTCKNLQT
jgi:hypothetical protein